MEFTPTRALSDMSLDEAQAACLMLPPRLLLSRFVSTRACRTAEAKRRACRHLLIALVPAIFLGTLLQLTAIGTYFSWLVAVAAVIAWPLWKFLREGSDAKLLYEREEWLDFVTREWRSQKRYTATDMPSVIQSAPLDAMMLFCAEAGGEDGWECLIGLVETAHFDPDSDSWPASFDPFLAAPPGPAALAFAKAVAHSWGIACWEFSGAVDVKSRRLC